MRQFAKFFFASMLGTIIGLAVFLLFSFLIIMGVYNVSRSNAEKGRVVKPNSVLELKLDYDIAEKSTSVFDPANFNFEIMTDLGLNDIIRNIKRAKTDDKIKGIYLNVSVLPSGFATVDAVRSALNDFKTSGKFVIAYGELITQKAYYLASVADEIYLNPTGFLELRGLNSELTFFKGMLDKLEIEVHPIYCGKYKSATEPFRLDKMSDENREQITFLIDDIYGRFVKEISRARNIDSAMVDNITDSMLVRDAEDAVKYKLVNGLLFYDQVAARLREKSGLGDKDELNLVALKRYHKKDDEKKDGKNKIAVLYAEGTIVDGKGEEQNIGSERIAKLLREIGDDEEVKALVFRINSGGGSALASDVILRELEVTRTQLKIPVIVSMGDVAASGGYYIACTADTIVAEPNTITGSIGVFGMVLNMQDFFNNKLGITFDGVKTGKFSDLGTPSRPITKEEEKIIQTFIDSVYLDFKEHVARGRNLTVDEVEAIAQGRVWTGVQAKERKLVDVLGNLDDAVKIASEKAGLKDYVIQEFPDQKENPLELMITAFGDDAEEAMIKEKLGEYYSIWKKMEEVKKMNGIQARMPFDLEIY